MIEIRQQMNHMVTDFKEMRLEGTNLKTFL